MEPVLQFSLSDYVRWTGQVSLFFVRVQGHDGSRLQTKSLFSDGMYLCEHRNPFRLKK